MARLGRKPVRPGRVTIAVTLGTLGLFVISMAAGLKSWPFGATGAAMLVVAVALLTTASMRGTEKAYVVGTVHVVKVSEPPLTSDYGRCEMQVLVDAPGHPGQTVVIRDPKAPVAKWPDVGETLPALVAVSDARRIKIQWDRVGAYGERYQAAAYPDTAVPDTTYDDEIPYDPTPQYVNSGPSYSDYQVFDDIDDVADPDLPLVTDTSSLPRRQPSPHSTAASHLETHSVAVLEGELMSADVPSPRSPTAQESLPADPVDAIDFSRVPEPAAATAAVQANGKPAEDVVAPVLVTQPNARPASAGSIHGVGITVLVTELDRSLRFYRDMLGFYEIDGGPETVILASGDTHVVLVSTQDLAPVNLRLVHLNLEVGDVAAVYEELKVRGIKFTYAPRVVNRGERLELVAAAFKDPDGHGIAITQWKARVN